VARLASRLVPLLALLVAIEAPHGARAQALQSVHVRAFSLSADRDTMRVGEQVHIAITIRVDEALETLDNVNLPEFFGFQILADERRLSSGPSGTTYIETITLSPTEAGTRRIGPVVLEAVDASTRRPSRFGSNTIEIRVLSAPAPVLSGPWPRIVQTVALIAGLTLGLILFLRLRKPQLSRVSRIEPAPSSVPAPSDPMPSEAERWRALVDALADHPTRENVIAVRTLLRQQAGARDDETFGDILARQATRVKPELLETMRAVERAAFIDDQNLAGAVREAVSALRRYAAVVGT
jgi:hypothetical protein